MPVIHVNVWEGFGPQKAKAAIVGITQVFVDLDIPARAVEVVVHEIPKSHWGVGGQPASEWAVGGPAAGEPARAQGEGVRGPAAGAEQT
jgi:4-oxalocrotonate tautomerase